MIKQLFFFIILFFSVTIFAQNAEFKLTSDKVPAVLNIDPMAFFNSVWILDNDTLTKENITILKSGEHTLKKYYFYKKNDKSKKSKAVTESFSFNLTPSNNTMVLLETKFGSMTIELYDDTPLHKANFIKLAKEGFYNGTLFHRVIKDFMIQGGDPTSKGADKNTPLGAGGPGYTIPAEFNNKYIHEKGALSAARQGDAVNPKRASSGSQFYIVQGSTQEPEKLAFMAERTGTKYTAEQLEIYKNSGGTPFLDNQYTVFGKVIQGLEVIDIIAAQKTLQGDRPAEDIEMKVTIVE